MTYGRDLIEASAWALLIAEGDSQGRGGLAVVDVFLESALGRMVDGRDPMVWTLRGARLEHVSFPWLDEELKHALEQLYQPAAIQSRGGWFLPEKGKVSAGWIGLLQLIDNDPRFATSSAVSVGGTLPLAAFEAVLAWALLSPLATALFAPFEVRGPLAGKLNRAELESRLHAYRELLKEIKVDPGAALDPFLPGHGWARMRAGEKAEARLALRVALADGWHDSASRLLRAHQLGELIRRYYSQAGPDGVALRRRVVSKQHAPAMVGLFAGDWLGFLSYIGERPHPDEEVIQALPASGLYVPTRRKIEEVGTTTGTPDSEMRKIAAALFGEVQAQSPIEDRLSLLRRIWTQVDEAHARQESGMRPIPDFRTNDFIAFHLVDDGYGRRPVETATFDSVLDEPAMTKVVDHWGTAVFDRWPQRLYTETLPFNHVLTAFGPALAFWHGVGLTAWYVAEGPTSRTDISGMPGYYEELLRQLDQSGHPVDQSLFADLKSAEKKLGPPEGIEQDMASMGPLTITMTLGQRREGFHHLRDVVTEHRRRWAAQHLDTYLERWRADLEQVHGEYNRRIADTGRKPTARQFATIASTAANSWFGGNLERVYAAIGEPALVTSVYKRQMPADVDAFVEATFTRLGGQPLERVFHGPNVEAEQEHRATVYKAADAARGALRLIQCREAKGEAPTIPEFGTGRWNRFSDLFSEGEAGWDEFTLLVDEIVAAPRLAQPPLPPSAPDPTPLTANPRPTRTAPERPAPGPATKKSGFLDRFLNR